MIIKNKGDKMSDELEMDIDELALGDEDDE